VHPYRIGGIFLGSIALIILGFLAVGFLLPSGWSAERSVTIHAPPDSIFPYLSRAEAWGEWTPSPEVGVELFGPEEGAGSGRRWNDEIYGEGEFLIREITPPTEVSYDVAVEGGSIRIAGVIRLSEEGGATLVQWREDGDFGWNPLLGYLSRRMDELQGTQLEASLATLRRLVEAGDGSEAPTPELPGEERSPSNPQGDPVGDPALP
jgi:hypothetical protein